MLVDHYLGRRIEVEAGCAHRGAAVRYHVKIDGQAMVNARGALRTWATREKALSAAKGALLRAR